ncbi:actin-associated protein FAM107A isoform X2 [Centropristis striata]|uniref:actin-associated protein FAM107A isoform X2 n=1 Tax=Centropristis striata TaxID=184440 RepID=UPI0027E014C7|nr:actin-associated protein FAM107A isoform X2 [Centropristis striata]
MGVTHGKKKDLQHSPEKHLNGSASVMQTHQTVQPERYSEPQAPLSQLQSEEEGSNLIRPQKPLNPLTASKSHQELHKELRMTHKRRVSQEGKTELQRALEKRRWEQRRKARSDQEEAKKNTSPLHQELLKRQQRLEELERDEGQQREGPEFLQVKERLRRTAVLDAGGNDV